MGLMFDVIEADRMRTTLAIDDDVLSAAKELASMQGSSVGEVISMLVRKALTRPEVKAKTRNGVPLLAVKPNTSPVTSEMVRELFEELP